MTTMVQKVLATVFFATLILSFYSAKPSAAIDGEQLRSALQSQLQNQPARQLGLGGHKFDAKRIDREITLIYQDNSMRPLWVTAAGPGKRAQTLLGAVVASDTQGLDPERYLITIIEKYWKSRDAVSLARLDILLTLALGGYVIDLSEGRLEPRKVDSKLFAHARDVEIDRVKLVRQVLAAPDLARFLDERVPPFKQYHALRKLLSEYRVIAARGGWQPIPAGKVLKPGMSDSRLTFIRKRLAATDDLKPVGQQGSVYDDKLVSAVKNFQERHGLDPDGVLGGQTLRAMNVSVEERIRQIKVNMERWRWVTRQPGDWVLVVNIAGYKVAGMRKSGIDLLMPVIVGKEYHMTPVFSDAVKYVEFNPFWNVPVSIARNEMLPKLRRDPYYLKKQHIRVFSNWDDNAKELDSTRINWGSTTPQQIARYHLRQDPGPHNALGTVKFIFPNDYNVYLHDTPAHSLFAKSKRAFSHGCIRVSRPQELAAYMLGGAQKGWTEERVKQIIAGGERKVVNLEKPLPIYIMYRTVVVRPGSSVAYFFEDVYGRDALLAKALFQKS